MAHHIMLKNHGKRIKKRLQTNPLLAYILCVYTYYRLHFDTCTHNKDRTKYKISRLALGKQQTTTATKKGCLHTAEHRKKEKKIAIFSCAPEGYTPAKIKTKRNNNQKTRIRHTSN